VVPAATRCGRSSEHGNNYVSVGLSNETVNRTDDRIPSTSKSAFAHVVFHATDRLNLSGGIRYTKDEKSYSFQRGNIYVPGLPTYTTAARIDGLTSTYEGDRWDFRANADYRFSDEILAYAQFSTGYRGGGVNPRPFIVEQAAPFGPQSLDAYEIGLKTDLFDRALRLNLSAFTFADGTGQIAGTRPDQRLSNLYEMYRATRPGLGIANLAPHHQVAYYDPGLRRRS